MSIKLFCDACDKPLTRNVVLDRLIVEQGKFLAEVIISKDNADNTGELCLECLMKMLTAKPKRKYTRKVKSISEQSQELSTTPVE